jgi:hypothetical protein
MEIITEARPNAPQTFRLRSENELATSDLRLFLVGAQGYTINAVTLFHMWHWLWEFPRQTANIKIPIAQSADILECTQALR